MARKLKGKKGKASRIPSKKAIKRPKPPTMGKASERDGFKTSAGPASAATTASTVTQSISDFHRHTSAFTIELGSIDGETTIGDLIVVFPRTRDVLMKHGLRFDVEEAGYIFMTLNVFSALHGLKVNGLIQELVAASKEVALQGPVQSFQPIAASPPA